MTESGNLHILFGPQGAGKTTYARGLAEQRRALTFSIDEWMQRLYGPDLPHPIEFAWLKERLERCHGQIWLVAQQALRSGADVVLDLGLQRRAERTRYLELAQPYPSRTYFVDAPLDLRRRRVTERNAQRGETFSFQVTPEMFDFMETFYEAPDEAELATVSHICRTSA
ncbi:ATP-binding protein [Deinococcus cavernae]|uniref:ATP-binding protein n=1 Tax=Deinococcus cavernae TaxID=2320857 RepID=A0A418V7P0_9DEIO|nr:ATP-binding protein [Deinococcus cavernae]RJF72105.1 ATP-binding protein [Deinococcus cavernae]